MARYVEPATTFVLVFGDPQYTLIDKLQLYHASAVYADKWKQSAEAWAAWAKLPANCIRAVEALLKLNWRKEFMQHGVCNALSATNILSYSKGKDKKKTRGPRQNLSSIGLVVRPRSSRSATGI